MRYFLRLSFKGTHYHGWQIQQNAVSVQSIVNHALSALLKKETETVGCGRTDTGVHARKFYTHFDAEIPELKPESFLHHLNAMLPRDIAVYDIFEVHEQAHARYDATSRTYEYRLFWEKNPFLQESAAYFPFELNMDRMNEFAAHLLTHHDFSCFSKSNTQTLTNLCEVSSASWQKEENELVFRITSDRFLRNMVRAIVGTLLMAGENLLSEEDFLRILESKDRREAGVSVPAHGLYLTDVKYPYLVSNE